MLDLHIDRVLDLEVAEQLVTAQLAKLLDRHFVLRLVEALLPLQCDDVLVFDPFVDLRVALANYITVGVVLQLIALLEQDAQVVDVCRVARTSRQLDITVEALHLREHLRNKDVDPITNAASLVFSEELRRVKLLVVVAHANIILPALVRLHVLACFMRIQQVLRVVDEPEAAILLEVLKEHVRCLVARQGERHIEFAMMT